MSEFLWERGAPRYVKVGMSVFVVLGSLLAIPFLPVIVLLVAHERTTFLRIRGR